MEYLVTHKSYQYDEEYDVSSVKADTMEIDSNGYLILSDMQEQDGCTGYDKFTRAIFKEWYYVMPKE